LPTCEEHYHSLMPISTYRGKRSANPAPKRELFRPEVKVEEIQGTHLMEENLTLYVFPGANITLDCLYLREFGTPVWKKGDLMAESGYAMSHAHIPHHVQSHDVLFNEVRNANGPDDNFLYESSIQTSSEIEIPGEWQKSGSQYRLYLTSVGEADVGRYRCYNPFIHSTANFVDVVVKEVYCEDPLVAPNVIKQGTDYSMGSIITYRCHGWRANRASMQVQCLSTGKWSAQPPSCTSLSLDIDEQL
ncbi:unnamed protein product, partial [Owenia fusiformis]